MKLIPITLATIAMLGAPIVGAVGPVHADPIEVTMAAGGESGNQVLEIPQACDQQGSPISCDQLSQNAVADEAAAVADGTVTPADPVPPVSSAQLAADGVGSMQDYQNQGAAGAAMMSAAPFAAPGLADPYARPRMMMVNPVVIGPFVGAGGPFIPRVMPAPGPIGTRPAWMMAPAPFMPMPMMGRPMAPAGMPQMLRLR